MVVIGDIQINAIKNKISITNSQENTHYNKISCRTCEYKLRFAKKCLFCRALLIGSGTIVLLHMILFIFIISIE